MITEKKDFLLEDKNKVNDFHMVYDPKEEKMLVYVEVDGKRVEAFIDKKELWSVAFAVSSEKDQETMIPVETRTTRVFRKQVTIRASKDIRKGESIVATVKFTVPLHTLIEASKNKHGIIMPK